MEKQTRPLRIAPVPESQRTGQVRELLDQVTIADIVSGDLPGTVTGVDAQSIR